MRSDEKNYALVVFTPMALLPLYIDIEIRSPL
jgi:hypothetical protein